MTSPPGAAGPPTTSGAGGTGTQLFVYGSLLDPGSLQGTLAHRRRAPEREVAVIHGWTRAWNCLSAKTFTLPGRGATRYRRVVMGLRPDDAGRSEGMVLQIDDRDLGEITRREQAYDLVDITDSVEAPPGRVQTFLPRSHNLRSRVTVPEPLVVERSYFATCCHGAAAHGLAAAEQELRASLDLELVDELQQVELRYLPAPP